MEKKKFTKLELNWILYDVGNSAFTMLVATILPIYFNALAESGGISEVDYLAYWGYAASVSTIIVAMFGPVLGSMADIRNFRKPLFTACVVLGVLACGLLWVPSSWFLFLVVFVISKVAYNTSLIFYDSMLVDVTTPERLDRVSSNGYAWGYIGSCIPFVISLVFVLLYESIGISMGTAMMIAFVINGAWWLVMSLPLIKNYKQVHYIEAPEHPVKESIGRIVDTLKDIKSQKHIFMYLLAFFFFIDGPHGIKRRDFCGLLLAILILELSDKILGKVSKPMSV